jgi:hypothetical protein
MKLLPFSNELQSFIKNNLEGPKYSPFSSKSKNFLLQIYEKMYKSSIQFKSLVINQHPYVHSKDTHYIPSEIKTIIENNTEIQTIKSYKFHTKNRTFIIHFHFYNKEMNTTTRNNTIYEYLKRIFIWLNIAEDYASSSCSQIMNIYIHFTNCLKILPPNKKQPIDRIHVNTAFTTPCSNTTNIMIFREEEWFKVFIHETFHNLGLDFSSINCESSHKFILQLFPVKYSEVSLCETYCEIFAEIINLQFISFYETLNKTNYQLMFNKFEKMVNIEMYFSLFQCVKVLHHYNMKYTDLYDTSSSSLTKREHYIEKTHVLSYFVIKSIFFFHKNTFLEWCIDNNKNTLDFKKTTQNSKKYCQLIYELYNNNHFLKEIAKIEEVLNTMKKNNNVNNNIYKTLRMTVYEFV